MSKFKQNFSLSTFIKTVEIEREGEIWVLGVLSKLWGFWALGDPPLVATNLNPDNFFTAAAPIFHLIVVLFSVNCGVKMHTQDFNDRYKCSTTCTFSVLPLFMYCCVVGIRSNPIIFGNISLQLLRKKTNFPGLTKSVQWYWSITSR